MTEYDDLFQIGCIGLCKAAATDSGIVCFSTYAYPLIWNEICDALIYASRRVSHETELDDCLLPISPAESGMPSAEILDFKVQIQHALENAPAGMRKGLACALLMAEGYTSQEAGARLQLPANSARALASRARRYLKDSPDYPQLAGGCL